MHVYIYLCMYACMYVWIQVSMNVWMFACIDARMRICAHVRMCTRMKVCMHVCIYVDTMGTFKTTGCGILNRRCSKVASRTHHTLICTHSPGRRGRDAHRARYTRPRVVTVQAHITDTVVWAKCVSARRLHVVFWEYMNECLTSDIWHAIQTDVHSNNPCAQQ